MQAEHRQSGSSRIEPTRNERPPQHRSRHAPRGRGVAFEGVASPARRRTCTETPRELAPHTHQPAPPHTERWVEKCDRSCREAQKHRNPALKENDDGDRGRTDRHDPTRQSRSASRSATCGQERSPSSTTPAAPRVVAAKPTRPSATAHTTSSATATADAAAPRTSAPNTSTRSPPRSPTTASYATSSTSGSTPPSN